MRVLVACEMSGIVRNAFISAGHDAMSCDLLPSEQPDPFGNDDCHYQGDVRELLEDSTYEFDLLIAHPTCTRLTNSGARWLTEPPKKLNWWDYPADIVSEYALMSRDDRLQFMWEQLRKGADFYNIFRDCKIKKKAIENPVMHCHAKALISTMPRHVVQPWWFGDPFFKATGWELTGLPPLIATNKLIPPKKGTEEHKKWSAVHRESPGPDRAKNRSRSFPGMANAMAEQWGGIL